MTQSDQSTTEPQTGHARGLTVVASPAGGWAWSAFCGPRIRKGKAPTEKQARMRANDALWVLTDDEARRAGR